MFESWDRIFISTNFKITVCVSKATLVFLKIKMLNLDGAVYLQIFVSLLAKEEGYFLKQNC